MHGSYTQRRISALRERGKRMAAARLHLADLVIARINETEKAAR